MFKRRRKQRTDYKQRLALLKSGVHRAVIRRFIGNLEIQFIDFTFSGDRVVAEISSRALKKYGWKGHPGNIPSAYLAGLLAGLRARKSGIKEAVLDIGLQRSVKGSSIYAAAAGIKDSGIRLPLGDVVPSQERVSGTHVAEYAKKLKKESQDKYRKQFSAYIKSGLDPEQLPSHFNDVRDKILAEFGPDAKKMITVSNNTEESMDESQWDDAG